MSEAAQLPAQERRTGKPCGVKLQKAEAEQLPDEERRTGKTRGAGAMRRRQCVPEDGGKENRRDADEGE